MECDIQAFIDKAKLLGLDIKIKDIPGYRNHTCKLISLSDTEHVIFIPDKVKEIDYYYGSFTKAIQNLRGNIKVIGGHRLTTAVKMFQRCHAQSLDLSSFDTSNITDMRFMFYACHAQILDLSTFDTSAVESMQHMFEYCHAKQIKITSFDTSNVTDMSYMFFNCETQHIDLSSFDTSKVKDMHSMFEFCKARSINVSSFNINNVTNIKNMFRKCSAEKIDISQWFNNGEEVYNKINIDNMFDGSTAMYKGTIILDISKDLYIDILKDFYI